MDVTTKRQLLEALDAAESASSTSCGFFACPGPDKPFVGMETCSVCRTVQLLRRAVVRLGLIATDACACCRMFPLCHGSFACRECGHAREVSAA
jgi:hypothetical protein